MEFVTRICKYVKFRYQWHANIYDFRLYILPNKPRDKCTLPCQTLKEALLWGYLGLFSSSDYVPSNGWVIGENNALGMICKEAALAQFKVRPLFRYFLRTIGTLLYCCADFHLSRVSANRKSFINKAVLYKCDSIWGLVVRVPGYRSRDPGSIPGATRFSEK
jgi:hypothetical protein